MIWSRHCQPGNITQFIEPQDISVIFIKNVFADIVVKLIGPVKTFVWLMPINQSQVMDNISAPEEKNSLLP